MNTPVDDSLTMVDPEVVYRVSFKVTQQILKSKLHDQYVSLKKRFQEKKRFH